MLQILRDSNETDERISSKPRGRPLCNVFKIMPEAETRATHMISETVGLGFGRRSLGLEVFQDGVQEHHLRALVPTMTPKLWKEEEASPQANVGTLLDRV